MSLGTMHRAPTWIGETPVLRFIESVGNTPLLFIKLVTYYLLHIAYHLLLYFIRDTIHEILDTYLAYA